MPCGRASAGAGFCSSNTRARRAKIRIPGGGRCNFTNLHASPDQFLSANSHFYKSALARYAPADFIALVDKHGIAHHEKTLGQLFCDGPARSIVGMLLAECAAAGVDLRLAHTITEVTRADQFRIVTDHGEFTAQSVVLATGGLSIPKMGATGFAHRIARQFGLALTGTRPARVPLTFEPQDLAMIQPLSGMALDVIARCGRGTFREAMLFTRRGLSGPAILQISSTWREGEDIILDLVPDQDAVAILREGKRARPKAISKTILAGVLPQRLADQLAQAHLLGHPAIGAVPDQALSRFAAHLKAWTLRPTGTEGYGKAEVTLGGIDTVGLSSRTMGANAVPGLFAIGEAVDVTGWLGGYNFQWAWSSGWVAGEAL
jgi:predicted Rossmann fold flavoprotein